MTIVNCFFHKNWFGTITIIFSIFVNFKIYGERIYTIIPKYENSVFNPLITHMNLYPYMVCTILFAVICVCICE